MFTGQDTLGSIESSLQQQIGKIQALEDSIEGQQADIARLRRADIDDFRELARLKLGSVSGKDMLARLDKAERRALELMKRREATKKSVDGELAAIGDRLAELARKRTEQAQAADRAAAAIEDAEAATVARLNESSDYAARMDQAKALERQAVHAAEKAAQSEQEEDQKGDSYRADPLFMYLWNRHYSLPAYTASGLISWLDGKVARLISYDTARANYARLHELPIRLRGHADKLSAEAEAAVAAVKAVYADARTADGIDALDADLAREHQTLDQIDEEIRDAEAEQQELLSRKGAFAAGDDEDTKQAVEYLAGEYSRDDLMQLLQEAIATPLPEDDAIVGRIIRRLQERQDLEATLGQLKETLAVNNDQLIELREVRDQFKQQRYEGRGSVFADGALIGMVLSEFLNGALGRGGLWDEINRQQRTRRRSRSDSDWGPWGGGSNSRGGWGDIFRKGGRGGRGGGFGTGGGFGGGGSGGGGFRTGGSF